MPDCVFAMKLDRINHALDGSDHQLFCVVREHDGAKDEDEHDKDGLENVQEGLQLRVGPEEKDGAGDAVRPDRHQ